MEVIALSLFTVATVIALLARYLRITYEEHQSFNNVDRVIPLEGPVNKLYFSIHDESTIFVKSVDVLGNGKILYKFERTSNNWNLSLCFNANANANDNANDNTNISNIKQKLVSSLHNSITEKFIVLNNTNSYRQSPLNTSISIMKLSFNWVVNFLFYNWLFQTDLVIKFTFGSDVFVSWVGLKFLEVITKEKKSLFNGLNNSHREDTSLINVRQRVVEASDFDADINGFILAFDYNRINIEIMLSTFLLSLLLQSHNFLKYVQISLKSRSKKISAV